MNPIARRLRLSLRPALVHLGLSATVALLAMALVFGGWYPGALAGVQGVSRLVLILIAVDVVIGPLVTWIVYVPGKQSLAFDLMVIAALQTAALLYGLQAIHAGRPAYVVFNVDRFDVVALKDVERDSLSRVPDGLGVRLLGPRWVAARLPADSAKRNEILFSAVGGGPDLPQLPEYYLPLADERPQMRQRLRPLAELRAHNALDEPAWQALLAGLGQPEAGLGYLPLVGKVRDAAVVLRADSGEVLGIRPLLPRFGGPKSGTEAPSPAGAPRAVPGTG